MNRLAVAVLAWVAALAACDKPDPPMLSLGSQTCDQGLNLTSAIDVSFGSGEGASSDLGAAGRCLVGADGQKTTYAVFRLPSVASPFQVTISSAVRGQAVVWPQAAVYDAAGARTREMPPSEFRSGIDGFTAGLRAQPSDRFVVVAASPASIGRPGILLLGEDAPRTRLAARFIIPVMPAPVEPLPVRKRDVVYALNGVVRVTAMPVERVP